MIEFNNLESIKKLSYCSKISCSRINCLIEMLNAPEDLSHFLLVLINLKRSISALVDLKTLCQDIEEEFLEDRSSFLNYLLDIGKLIDVLSHSEIDQFPSSWLNWTGRQHGIINDHPEWSMLILLPSSECYSRVNYWQHVGLVVCLCTIQRKRHRESIGSEITGACRDIRMIASNKRPLELLGDIDADTTLESYHKNHLHEEEKPLKYLTGIELLVRKILIHKGKTRTGGGGGGSVHVVERHVVETDADDEEHEGPIRSVQLLESGGDSQFLSRQRSAGLHPQEAQTLRAVSFTESTASPTSGFDLRDLIRRQHSQVQHISQDNQRLPYRFSSLSKLELSKVHETVCELVAAKGCFEKRDKVELWAGILLMLMLWLGRPVEQLLHMRVYNNKHDLPSNRKNLLAFLIEEQSFALPIPSPQWRNSLKDDAKSLLDTASDSKPALVDDVIIVASSMGLGPAILKAKQKQKVRARYCELFPEDSHVIIEKSMRHIVSKINRANKMRLTPLRISRSLFDEITQCSTDWVDAYLLTGHKFTISEVASHYYSVSAAYLEELYHEATVSLRKGIKKYVCTDKYKFTYFRQLVRNEGDHGSKLNIKLPTLVLLVRHLKNVLRSSRRLPPSDESFRLVHNDLVAYISFWVLFSTGYRAVNDLVFRWREIDFDTGFLSISDKDNEDMSLARVVWLLPELREQLREYARHLDVLQFRIYHRASLHGHIEDLLSNPHPSVPLLFFISESWQMIQLTPENLRHQVPVFGLPINTGRHFLRSALRKEGVAGELVNALMGHSQHGQEPFGSYSTLTPVELFNELAPVLEKMRYEAAWTVQRGLADA